MMIGYAATKLQLYNVFQTEASSCKNKCGELSYRRQTMKFCSDISSQVKYACQSTLTRLWKVALDDVCFHGSQYSDRKQAILDTGNKACIRVTCWQQQAC